MNQKHFLFYKTTFYRINELEVKQKQWNKAHSMMWFIVLAISFRRFPVTTPFIITTDFKLLRVVAHKAHTQSNQTRQFVMFHLLKKKRKN